MQKFLNPLSLGIVIVWIVADQALKLWTMAHIPFRSFYYFEPIPGFLSLGHDVNLGAAWSLFAGAGASPVLILVRSLAGLALLLWLWQKPRSKLETMAVSLIAAGAWGNCIDGILRGGVVDMLQSHWLSAIYQPIFGTPFPIFNLADTGVVVGVILWAGLQMLQKPRRIPKLNAEQTL
jgi:signal peptidase II